MISMSMLNPHSMKGYICNDLNDSANLPEYTDVIGLDIIIWNTNSCLLVQFMLKLCHSKCC